jgi:hypothetical protein
MIRDPTRVVSLQSARPAMPANTSEVAHVHTTADMSGSVALWYGYGYCSLLHHVSTFVLTAGLVASTIRVSFSPST